jgi:hypothetical protein
MDAQAIGGGIEGEAEAVARRTGGTRRRRNVETPPRRDVRPRKRTVGLDAGPLFGRVPRPDRPAGAEEPADSHPTNRRRGADSVRDSAPDPMDCGDPGAAGRSAGGARGGRGGETFRPDGASVRPVKGT